MLGHFLGRPFFAHVAIENLKLFRIDFLFHPRDRSLEQIFLPLALPDRIKIDARANREHARLLRLAIVRRTSGAFGIAGFAFAKLIDNSPARDLQQPAFERTDRWIVFQFVDVLGDRDDGFLHDFLRFGIGETGFARGRVNQLPVRVEKFLPVR